MKIKLDILEPWALPQGLSRTLVLSANDTQSDADAWRVQIVNGWNTGENHSASLAARYEGEELAELYNRKSLFVNLVLFDEKRECREMVIGKASILES
jgi:hypothetical protein